MSITTFISDKYHIVLETISEYCSEYLENRFHHAIDLIGQELEGFKITPEEEALFYKGWCGSNEEMSNATTTLVWQTRYRLGNKCFDILLPLIHRSRYYAVLLQEEDYTNYMVKIGAVYSSVSELGNRITDAHIKLLMDKCKASDDAVEAAKKELKITGVHGEA